MKKLRIMVSTLAVVVCFGALLQGCMLFGHGDDADPFTEGETQIQGWEDVFGDEEELSVPLQSRVATQAVAENSLQVIGGMVNDIGFQISEIALTQVETTKSVNKARDRNPPAYQSQDVSLIKSGPQGGSVVASGKCITVRKDYEQCAIVADLTIRYSSYVLLDGTTISGTYDAKVIATSYACAYHKNMHIDFKMIGDLDVNQVEVEEIEYTADYHYEKGGAIWLPSAVVNTIEGYHYCYDGPYDAIECVSGDGRPLDDFCSSDDDVCDVSTSGHTSCAEDMPTGNEGHCNLGCCAPQLPEVNTCNDAWTNRRECDPAVDTLFTARYEFRPTTIHDYETYLVCTPDGLWSPPCIPGSADNICPMGSTCVDGGSVNWGGDLSGYGYCSCTGE